MDGATQCARTNEWKSTMIKNQQSKRNGTMAQMCVQQTKKREKQQQQCDRRDAAHLSKTNFVKPHSCFHIRSRIWMRRDAEGTQIGVQRRHSQ
jgi:protein tyrosine phosphatase